MSGQISTEFETKNILQRIKIYLSAGGEAVGMTLVQASIADDGNTVVLIADRLLTTALSRDIPTYEFEAGTPKIIHKGYVGIGFAGSSLHADTCTAKFEELTDFDKIVETISQYISSEREKQIDKEIKRKTGVSSNDFFTNPQLPIPQEVRDTIYANIDEFYIECESIVAGFDKKDKGRIVVVANDGDTYEATTFNAFSIGSGAPFSQVYFDQLGYNPRMSANEGVLFAFEAKKWAQSHTGVGEKTDMIVFKKEGNNITVEEIYDGSKLMKEMKHAYQTEIQKRDELRKKLIKKFFGGGGE